MRWFTLHVCALLFFGGHYGFAEQLNIGSLLTSSVKSVVSRFHMNLAIEHLNNKNDGWWDDIWSNMDPSDQFTITYGKDFCGPNGPTSDEAVNILKNVSSVVGVIGAVCADSTKIIQPIFRYVKKPIVSWATGTADLSDKSLYPWFMRTVVSDGTLYKGLIEIMLRYKWKKIAVIQDDSDFGMVSSRSFRAAAALSNVTAGTNEIIPRGFTDMNLATAMLQRIKAAHYNIILLFVSVADANKIGQAAYQSKMYGAPYVWVGTMAWTIPQLLSKNAVIGAPIDQNVLTAFQGLLSVYWKPPIDTYIGQKYTNYLKSFNSSFTDLQSDISRSFMEVKPSNSLSYSTVLQFNDGLQAYDAVITYAYAISKLKASGVSVNNSTAMLQNMIKSQFDGVSGRVQFDVNGEREVAIGLDILNLQLDQYEKTQQFNIIGRWEPTTGLQLSSEPIWAGNVSSAPNDGQCTATCVNGECDHDRLICRCYPGYSGIDCSILAPMNITLDHQQRYLIPCGQTEFIYTFAPEGPNKNLDVQIWVPKTLSGSLLITSRLFNNATNPLDRSDLPYEETSNGIKYHIQTDANYTGGDQYILIVGTPDTKCDAEEFQLIVDFSNKLIRTNPLATVSYVLFAISSAAFCLLIWFGVTLYRHRQRKIFRKSGIDAVSTIVVGSAIGFAGPIIQAWVPTQIGCVVFNWTYHFAFWLVYGSLLSKNWRIYWIFNNKGKQLGWSVKDVNGKTAIIAVLLTVYMTIWTTLNYNDTLTTSSDEFYIFESCKTSSFGIGISVAEFVFLCGCAALAWKTRSIPDDFNESKMIAIATYNAFILKIFNILLQSMSTAQGNIVIQAVGANLEIFLSYLVTVVIIFVPKMRSVYIEKHPQDRSTGEQGTDSLAKTSRKGSFASKLGQGAGSMNAIGTQSRRASGQASNYTMAVDISASGYLGSRATINKASMGSINVLKGIHEESTTGVMSQTGGNLKPPAATKKTTMPRIKDTRPADPSE